MPSELEVGDILIDMDGSSADHSLMWVGGDKPIVHNAEGSDFVGVIRQSARPYLTTKEDSKRWKPSPRVYRPNGDLGTRAASFAIDWATRSDDEVYVELKKLDYKEREQRKDSKPRQKRAAGMPKNITIGSPAFDGAEVVLDTPFSQDRLEPNEQPWTVLSLFRALRAYHRGTNQLPLSQLKGVTCSQFITYCYQAAAIQRHLGNQQIPRETLDQIPTSKKFYSLSLKRGEPGTPHLIETALNGIDTRFMPQAMLVDAKTSSASRLMDALDKDATGFRFAGYLAPTAAGNAILVQPTEFKDGMTWGDLRKITG